MEGCENLTSLRKSDCYNVIEFLTTVIRCTQKSQPAPCSLHKRNVRAVWAIHEARQWHVRLVGDSFEHGLANDSRTNHWRCCVNTFKSDLFKIFSSVKKLSTRVQGMGFNNTASNVLCEAQNLWGRKTERKKSGANNVSCYLHAETYEQKKSGLHHRQWRSSLRVLLQIKFTSIVSSGLAYLVIIILSSIFWPLQVR